MADYETTIRFNLNEPYYVVAFYPIKKNGCCDKDWFLLTANKCPSWKSGINYSCQCACGGWCTTGFETEQEAVNEYRRMCDRTNFLRRITKNEEAE